MFENTASHGKLITDRISVSALTDPNQNLLFRSKYMAQSSLPKSNQSGKNKGRRSGNYRHGEAGTPIYVAYYAALNRCRNPENHAYARYGVRGIEFRFTSYHQFKEEMGPRPSATHSVNRIDNDGNYEPGNVAWATKLEQILNRRNTSHLTIGGRTQLLQDWATEVGVRPQLIVNRRFIGWCDECSVFIPVNGQKNQRVCPHKKTFGEKQEEIKAARKYSESEYLAYDYFDPNPLYPRRLIRTKTPHDCVNNDHIIPSKSLVVFQENTKFRPRTNYYICLDCADIQLDSNLINEGEK